jgi:hypothetical protein
MSDSMMGAAVITVVVVAAGVFGIAFLMIWTFQ